MFNTQLTSTYFQIRFARSGDVPGLLPTKPPVRVPTVIGDVYVLPWLSHHATGRVYRLRPARARRQIQKDGGDRHSAGHAQELIPPSDNLFHAHPLLYTIYLLLTNFNIGRKNIFAFLLVIRHQIIY